MGFTAAITCLSHKETSPGGSIPRASINMPTFFSGSPRTKEALKRNRRKTVRCIRYLLIKPSYLVYVVPKAASPVILTNRTQGFALISHKSYGIKGGFLRHFHVGALFTPALHQNGTGQARPYLQRFPL